MPAEGRAETLGNGASRADVKALQVGSVVMVRQTFQGQFTGAKTLEEGCCGVVRKVDADGDNLVDFFSKGSNGASFAEWVFRKDLHMLAPACPHHTGTDQQHPHIASSEEEQDTLSSPAALAAVSASRGQQAYWDCPDPDSLHPQSPAMVRSTPGKYAADKSSSANPCAETAQSRPRAISKNLSADKAKSGSDAADRADCKRRTFRDLVHLQAKATKELETISSTCRVAAETMSEVCAEMRQMRQAAREPRQVAPAQLEQMLISERTPQAESQSFVADGSYQPMTTSKRWAQRREEFQKRRCMEELRHLFQQGGLDPDGRHSHAEVGAVITLPAVRTFFEYQFPMGARYPDEVFHLLELDGEGKASLAEFIEGCVELKDADSVRTQVSQLLSRKMSESMRAVSSSISQSCPEPSNLIRPLSSYDCTCLPEVEVSIRVNHLANVDTNMLRFEADFTIRLAWQDDQVPDDDVEAHELDWTDGFFNPSIVVEGLDHNPEEAVPLHAHPLFVRPASDEPKWCTKTCRFRGSLCMPEVDLRCFPFDYQLLPIKVTAQRISFGDVRNAVVRLKAPALQDSVGRHLWQEYNSREAKFRHNGSYCASTGPDSCMADCMVEFKIHGLYSFPVQSLIEPEGEAFQVTVVVKRPIFGHQLGESCVLIMLTLLSAVSFWDVASADLSSRMSITLTIILTLAAYTSSRPTAIEKCPYPTIQDRIELIAMCFAMVVAIQNVIAVVHCGGEDQESPSFMQAFYSIHEDGMCAESHWGLRYIDFCSLMVLGSAFVVALFYTAVKVKVMRDSLLKNKLKDAITVAVPERPGTRTATQEFTGAMGSYSQKECLWLQVQQVVDDMKSERLRANNFAKWKSLGQPRISPE